MSFHPGLISCSLILFPHNDHRRKIIVPDLGRVLSLIEDTPPPGRTCGTSSTCSYEQSEFVYFIALV